MDSIFKHVAGEKKGNEPFLFIYHRIWMMEWHSLVLVEFQSEKYEYYKNFITIILCKTFKNLNDHYLEINIYLYLQINEDQNVQNVNAMKVIAEIYGSSNVPMEFHQV